MVQPYSQYFKNKLFVISLSSASVNSLWINSESLCAESSIDA